MFRASRRLTTALLWLAIALLPVRGWAVTLMPMVMAMNGAPVAEVVSPEEAPAPQAVPCHGMAHHDDGTAPTDTTSTCSLCDLCHSTVVHAPAALTLPVALQEADAPSAQPARVTSRQPDGLFRPPRSTFA